MKKNTNEIIDDTTKITNELLIYENKKKLSWNKSYKDVLSKLNMQDKKDNPNLLNDVVTKITRLGYDIKDNPFSLIKYN